MSLTREYVAASVNNYPNVLDWGHNFISFATCNAIGIYDTRTNKTDDLLCSHSSEVRCVRWIVPDHCLISASADTTAKIWKRNEDDTAFHSLLTLPNSAPLIVADSKLNSDGSFTSVTSATDFTISLFRDDHIIHRMDLKKYVFDLRLVHNESFWGNGKQIVSYSTDDSRVNLAEFRGGSFVQLLSLAGHEDWSRSIDHLFTADDRMLLASASQDGFVRVWTIVRAGTGKQADISDKVFIMGSDSFNVSLETVLAGHENHVLCVKFINEHSIITASLDKTLIVWSPSDDGVWIETTRVGEVGGNNMGFMGCTFPRRQPFTTFAGYSFNGSVHFWFRRGDDSEFESVLGFGGHRKEVTDISWESTGKYLLSVSMDQTTRLHAKCESSSGKTWHEIARPQIHGYDMNCLSIIDGCTFVTGADEKVLRVFRATKSFISSFHQLTGVKEELDSSTPVEKLPLGSSVPALGLTNRAVYDCDNNEILSQSGDKTQLSGIPTEETLMQATLWPEIHKLYGHGNELFAVAVNHRKTLLVSACKSAKADHAGLIFWNMRDDFKVSQKLPGHQLTVTSIAFSPSDRYLVSVSRDRTWFLYRETEQDHFEKVSFSDKKTCVHSRIIWDVRWTPDSRFFLTCSRDKKLIFWQIHDQGQEVRVEPLLDHVLSQDHPVMTCDILNKVIDGKFIVSFGLEDGSIHLFKFSTENSWQPFVFINNHILQHHLSVRKIRFKPAVESDSSEISVASCSDDRSVQIFVFNY